MTQRITKANLERMAENCNRIFPPQNNWKFSIEYAYGRPRLVLEDPEGCCRDISPRLPKGQLAEWIWAFQKGAEFMTRR